MPAGRVALITGTAVAGVAGVAAAGFAAWKAGYLTKAPVDENVAAVLKGNEKLFSSKELALIAELIALGQSHLFSAWPAPGTSDAQKRKLVAQLVALNRSYHGGLAAYVTNARKLLQDSKEGRNPFDGYTPSVPAGERLDFMSADFMDLEKAGLTEAASTAFVLVAGGLGERLGYSGIKVALPSESTTGASFLELYAQYILALQARSGAKSPLPFAIMTSDDTHARTKALLEEHKYFGLAKSQVTLVKQEKVACLVDNDATLALDPADSFAVQTKPHGHGDVHALLHSSGLASKWHRSGLKWVAFFQDTNAQVIRALTAALGVSAKRDLDMNSLCVPRKAKEAIGAIASLQHKDGGALTINVEYNQLDPLLRSTVSKEGDVNDATGFSPYPGNINQLVLKLDTYVTQLARAGGIISEFVNPKYKDATKTAFKSSTRLECMMQDYPKALPKDAKVGFTTINQVWASYSPVKNSPADAAAKAKEGNPTHSATSAEFDVYKTNTTILKDLVGAKVPAKPESATFNGIASELYPRVVLTPSFAPVLSDIKDKITSGSITLAPSSVLVLDGPGIKVKGPVKVSGALVIRAAPGAEVEVGDLVVSNAGWEWVAFKEGEEAPEEERIRGFRVVKKDTTTYEYTKPGSYKVSNVAAEPDTPTAAPPTPAPSLATPAASMQAPSSPTARAASTTAPAPAKEEPKAAAAAAATTKAPEAPAAPAKPQEAAAPQKPAEIPAPKPAEPKAEPKAAVAATPAPPAAEPKPAAQAAPAPAATPAAPAKAPETEAPKATAPPAASTPAAPAAPAAAKPAADAAPAHAKPAAGDSPAAASTAAAASAAPSKTPEGEPVNPAQRAIALASGGGAAAAAASPSATDDDEGDEEEGEATGPSAPASPAVGGGAGASGASKKKKKKSKK